MAVHKWKICVLCLVIHVFALSLVLCVKEKFVMVGTYCSIHCDYDKSLGGKVFYIFLSWDPDNAVAYIYKDQLVRNSETALYRKARAEGFTVARVAGRNKLQLLIQHVRLRYQNLTAVCLVKDDDGRGAVLWKKTTILKVIDPPRILRFKGSVINVTLGDSRRVELVCTAVGFPPPAVRWWKRGRRELVQPQVFNNKTLTAHYYLPTPFRASQDGNYLCEAVTAHRYMESIGLNKVISSVRLNVQYPPKVETKETIVYTDIGLSVNVIVKVAGNPQPQLDCSFLTIRAPKFIRVQGQPSPHHFRYEVVLPHVRASHITDYPCRATNFLGADSTLIRLRLGPSRPIILSPYVSEFANYYPLWWSVLSFARLRNVSVEVSRRRQSGDFTAVRTHVAPVYNARGSPSMTSPNQTYLYHVTNLAGNTTYAVRLRTCNRHQCSPYSRLRSFRTTRDNGTNSIDPQTFLRQRQQHHLTTTLKTFNPRFARGCPARGFDSYACVASSSLASAPTLLRLLLPAVSLLHRH